MLNDVTIRLFLVLIAIFNLIDAVFTASLYKVGLIEEKNPIMQIFIEFNASFFIFFKVFLVSLACFWLWKRRDNKYAVLGIILCFITYFCLMLYFLHNIL